MKVKLDTYAHGCKEDGFDYAERLEPYDLTEKAKERLRYINYGVKLTHEVDTETGESKIIAVDGRKVEDEES